MRKGLFLLVFCLFFNGSVWAGWRSIETDNFKVFYPQDYKQDAYNLLYTIEYYRPSIEKLTGNKLHKLPIVLDNAGQMVNGYANPIFYNIHIYNYQPKNELGSVENWYRLVGIHEYIHMMHMTKTSGSLDFWKNTFGNIFCPNIFGPGWVTEGITVYGESQNSKYEGRLNDGLFRSYLDVRINNNAFPNIFEATNTPLSFPWNTNYYLYGGLFFEYLADEYGEDKFKKFFRINGSKSLSILSPIIPRIGIDDTAIRVYNKTFPELWKEWENYETNKSKHNKREGVNVTNYGWIIKYLIQNKQKIYFVRQYPIKTSAFKTFTFTHLIQKDLKSGKETILINSLSDICLPLKIKNNKIYYAIKEIKTGYANISNLSYGTLTILREKNIKSGKNKFILKDSIRAFCVLDKDEILYSKDKEYSFGSILYRYDPTSKLKTKVLETDYLINEIVIIKKGFGTRDSRIIISARKDWENFSIYELKDSKFIPLVSSPYTENQLSIYDDKLYYSANYNGLHRTYSLDLNTNKIYQLTETEFSSYASPNQNKTKLFFIGLNSYGFDIYKKTLTLNEYKIPNFKTNKKPEIHSQNINIKEGKYSSNLNTLIPKIRYPIIYTDEDDTFFGFGMIGSDAIGYIPTYTAILAYNPEQDKLNSSIHIDNNIFRPISSYVLYDTFDDDLFRFSLLYPLRKSITSHLQNTSIGTFFDFHDNSKHKEITPNIYNKFVFPKTTLDILVENIHEKKSWDSFIDREGIHITSTLRQYLLQGEFNAKIFFSDDPDSLNIEMINIRGYSNEIPANSGTVYTLQYSHPLIKIRKGIWNPNAYLEDIFITGFFDEAHADDGRTQNSYGLEFHAETKLFFNLLPLNTGFRITRTKHKNTISTIFITSQI